MVSQRIQLKIIMKSETFKKKNRFLSLEPIQLFELVKM